MALALSRDGGLAYLDDVKLYDKVTALASVETTIINYTVPVNTELALQSVTIGGNDRGQFIVKVNGTEEHRIRNAWTDRTKEHSLGEQKLSAGDILVVSVINDGDLSNTFEARINAKKL